MDQRSLDKLNQLHPKLRDAAINAYNEAVSATPNGVHPTVDQTFRTFEESDRLYQQGRTTPGEIVSNAKAGQSWHNWGLALDFHLIINDKDIWDQNNPNWIKVVNIFKSHGFTWGGDWNSFKDYPHLENKLGQTLTGLMNLKNKGKLISGTEYVDF